MNLNKNFIQIFKYLILVNLIIPVFSQINRKLTLDSSIITIRINGTGQQTIFNPESYRCPDEIFLNDTKIGEKLCSINLEKKESTIIMKWNNHNITSCKKLFSGLSNITEIDLSKFDTSNVNNMESMFSLCISLNKINLLNIDTSSVINMNNMFKSCKSLKFLDISNFNTSKVTSMSYMFSNCILLQSLDLSNFKTLGVVSMEYMFSSCRALKSLNIISFDTSKVISMKSMFSACSSLIYLDLFNFNTSKITNMDYMFTGCSKIISLDLSSFNTINIKSMIYTFTGCSSLKYLNLSSFNTSSVNDMYSMFNGCSSLISLNLSNFDTSNVNRMSEMFFGCQSLKVLDLSNFNLTKVANFQKMFFKCKNLVYIKFINAIGLNKLKNENIFSSVPENVVVCTILNNTELNEIINKYCYSIDCSNNWRDNQKKIIADNNTCIESCSNNSKYIYEFENKCYEKCPNGTHSNNYLCEVDESDNIIINVDEVDKITNSLEFNKYGTNDIKDNDNNICDINKYLKKLCKINIQNNEDKVKFNENIIKEIINGSLDDILFSIVNDKKNIIIVEGNERYEISTLSNQMDIEYDNLTLVVFGKCENILRKQYNISEKDEIIIFKVEHYIQEYNIPILEYVLFSEDGKNKLDLNYCNNIPILYYISVSINENELYKYDPSNNYYNDRCYPFTTKNKTDITLYDRRNDYNENNMSLCESNCTYKGYDSNIKKAECECHVKSQLLFFSNITIDINKLLNKFTNFKKISNIDIIKCHQLLFSKEGLISNIGSYLLLSIIFITIISLIFFSIKGYNLFYQKIQRIIIIIKNIKKNNVKQIQSTKNKNKGIIKNEKKKKNIKKQKKIKINTKRNIKQNIKLSFFNNSKSNYSIQKKSDSQNNLNISNINIEKEEIQNNKDKNDYELNSLSYEDALKYDKRKYCEYYFSLIRTKHLLIFTFYTKNDYNSRTIKISFFFFLFSLLYAVNALFFNDSTMHQIYEDNGEFNFVYQIPQILYSTLISSLIKNILNTFSSTENNIITLKNKKIIKGVIYEMNTLTKCLKIKFVFFFIFNFLFLFLFWYYLSCFCAVYKNTQTYLIKDTFISFGTSLLYPFGIYLLPGIFRIPSLNSKNKRCMYIICKLIQLI